MFGIKKCNHEGFWRYMYSYGEYREMNVFFCSKCLAQCIADTTGDKGIKLDVIDIESLSKVKTQEVKPKPQKFK